MNKELPYAKKLYERYIFLTALEFSSAAAGATFKQNLIGKTPKGMEEESTENILLVMVTWGPCPLDV